jgi:hypothetical protein
MKSRHLLRVPARSVVSLLPSGYGILCVLSVSVYDSDQKIVPPYKDAMDIRSTFRSAVPVASKANSPVIDTRGETRDPLVIISETT